MRRAAKLSISPLRYLLLAQFNAPNQGYADGQVLDHMGVGCENGQLTVVEVDGTLSIVGNRCAFTAQGTPTYSDLGAYSQAITKALGLGLLVTVNADASNKDFYWPAGFMTTADLQMASREYTYRFYSDGTIRRYYQGLGTTHESYSASTDYQLAIILGGYDSNGIPWRSGEVATNYLYGVGFYIRGGAFTDWTLLWKDDRGNTSTLYAAMGSYDAAGTLDNFRVPEDTLEAVLQSNNLSTFTAANGTSLDSIVPEVGAAWTERTGNFDIQTNRANISVASGGRDVATKPSSIADGLFDVVIRKTNGVDSGEFGRCLRYSDDNNFWMVQGDLTNNQVEIVERNGGVETVRASSAVALTHTVDYDVRGIAYGQTIDAFLDGGNKCTYALAALNENATIHGIVGDGVGETFDICADFARTSSVYDRTLSSV